MSDIVLWSYDASPFTQKALAMLGIKRLEWQWVETPMMPPKDDLVALTGGYRGTPVMQIGADVYIDSQLIALELERRHPEPTLFPGADPGLALMLAKWSEAFFRAGLAIAVHLTASAWPDPFLKDRQYLFGDFDWDGTRRDSTHARSQFRAHAGLIERQLADGRRYLTGDLPGLADIQAYAFAWMARAYVADAASALLGAFAHLNAWEERMRAIGDGKRSATTADHAFAIARSARSSTESEVDAADPTGLRRGDLIEVAPDDTRRGSVRGELVLLRSDEVALRRHDALCGDVVVHFPRLGYRIERA
jgi:glutathione S-transferase